MKKLAIAVAGTLLLTSCVGIAPGTLPGAGKLVTVKGAVKVVESKFELKAVTEKPRVPYELRRLDHIEVWIENTDLGGGASLAGSLPYQGSSDADHTFAPIELKNLKSYSHYKVTLKAFQFDPAANAGTGGIVQVDENGAGESETTFDTILAGGAFTDAANEFVELAGGFNLKLMDQPFNGTASGDLDTNLAVDDGVLVDPLAAETVHIPPPPPITNFVVQIWTPGTGFLNVDSDLRVFYDGANFDQVHSSNPCGGGFGCGTPGDPAYDPTSGSFFVNDPAPEGDIASFTITDVPETFTFGVLRLQYNRHTSTWEFLDFTPDAGNPTYAIRALGI